MAKSRNAADPPDATQRRADPEDDVQVERRGDAAWITIDRPSVLNAMDPETATRLRAAVEDADDAGVRAIVITGAGGRAFSVGADLKWRASHPAAAARLPIGGGLHVPGLDGFVCHTPLIAAVDGLALGGGFELVLACDFAIATARSSFGLPEVSVGLVADAGGVHRLVRQLPWKLAMDVLLAGRRLTATEALGLGIVNEVVQSADLTAAVETLIGRLRSASPLAVRATKETAEQSLGKPLPEVMSVRTPLHEQLLRSPDAVEGPRAFAEKRPPSWMPSNSAAQQP